jgi:transcriptional regulator with XRE-family HTH domain
MPKKQAHPLTDQLRQAIVDSGLTRYRIAKETGVSEATLSKFHLGQRGLSMTAMDRVGELLGLKIVAEPKSKGRQERG